MLRFLFITCVLLACTPPSSPVPTAIPTRSSAQVNFNSPRDYEDLQVMARAGEPREVLRRTAGDPPTCGSLSVAVLIPAGTPKEQYAADLLQAMFTEGAAKACGGGNVWGYPARDETVAQDQLPIGRLQHVNRQGSHEVQYIFGEQNVWTVAYRD